MPTVIIGALSYFLATALLYLNFDWLFMEIEATIHLGFSFPRPAWVRSSMSVLLVSTVIMFVSQSMKESRDQYPLGRKDIIFALGLNNVSLPAVIFALDNYDKVIAFASKDGCLIISTVLLAITTILLLVIIGETTFNYAKSYKINFSSILGVFLSHGLATRWLLSL